jgi:hypothetical protein
MSAPQSLLQAAVNRLAARLGSGLADSAATLSLLAQDAPARLQQELQLFWAEVEQEAARLDRQASPAPAAAAGASTGASPGASPGANSDPQVAIDRLRAQVARLARRLEAPSSSPASGWSTNAAAGSGSQEHGPV